MCSYETGDIILMLPGWDRHRIFDGDGPYEPGLQTAMDLAAVAKVVGMGLYTLNCARHAGRDRPRIIQKTAPVTFEDRLLAGPESQKYRGALRRGKLPEPIGLFMRKYQWRKMADLRFVQPSRLLDIEAHATVAAYRKCNDVRRAGEIEIDIGVIGQIGPPLGRERDGDGPRCAAGGPGENATAKQAARDERAGSFTRTESGCALPFGRAQRRVGNGMPRAQMQAVKLDLRACVFQ